MTLIKGITVTLYEKTLAGKDDFNGEIYTETPVQIENVLVTPTASTDVISELSLSGKRAEYEICIPKGDTHAWENCKVYFFGVIWQVVGFEQSYIEENLPLAWNKKIKVERYG